VLQTVSREKIEQVLADPAFRQTIDGLVESKQEAENQPVVPAESRPVAAACVAYFSMESC